MVLPDLIEGLEGNDTLQGLGGNDILLGSAGRDTLEEGATREIMFGDLTIEADPNNSSNSLISLTATNDIIALVEGVTPDLITVADFG